MKSYLDCWISVAGTLFSQALAGEPERPPGPQQQEQFGEADPGPIRRPRVRKSEQSADTEGEGREVPKVAVGVGWLVRAGAVREIVSVEAAAI